jgi:hypothetical protein
MRTLHSSASAQLLATGLPARREAFAAARKGYLW